MGEKGASFERILFGEKRFIPFLFRPRGRFDSLAVLVTRNQGEHGKIVYRSPGSKRLRYIRLKGFELANERPLIVKGRQGRDTLAFFRTTDQGQVLTEVTLSGKVTKSVVVPVGSSPIIQDFDGNGSEEIGVFSLEQSIALEGKEIPLTIDGKPVQGTQTTDYTGTEFSATPLPTAIVSSSLIPTVIVMATATSTVTSTATATSTFTVPPTYTPYPTFTNTATFTATNTPTSTPTGTPMLLPPSITSLSTGIASFGHTITINGSNFTTGATAQIGSVACSSTTYINSLSLSCTLPIPGPIATYAVTVVNPDNQSTTLPNAITYLGDPIIWLKADAIPSQLDGSSVATWTDASRYLHHATQSSSSLRPTYVTNGINNLPSVQFDASVFTFLTIANDASLNPTSITMLTVSKNTTSSVSNTRRILGKGCTSSWIAPFNQYSLGIASNLAPLGRFAVGPLNILLSGSSGGVANSPYIDVGRYDDSTFQLWRNGVIVGAGIASTSTACSSTFDVAIGANHPTVGDTTRAWNGLISEILVYGSSLSSSERIIVNSSYLNAKYNVY